MIGLISGTLLEKHPPQILVEVNGVGYELDVPMSTFYTLPASGQRVRLYTHLLVREDAHVLYGFASEEERGLFRQLIKVSGVGAKTALALLSGLSVQELAQAVALADAARLTRVPGIGKKTAERLLLELKDKLAPTGPAPKPVPVPEGHDDVLNALLALGYNPKEAAWAIEQLPPDCSVSDGIRQALKLLAKV